MVMEDPNRLLGLFEEAATEFARSISESTPPIQVLLTTSTQPIHIRDINSKHIHKLIVVPGLVIGAYPVRARATEITAVCSGCQDIYKMQCHDNNFVLPRKCQRPPERAGGAPSAGAKCPLDPYVIIPELSKFSDYQFLKLQEAPEDVPAGEMPGHISAYCDRALVNSTIPGSRNRFVAIYSMQSGKNNIQKPVLHIVGLMGQNQSQQTTERAPTDLFPNRNSIIKAIAPEIFGNEDVKIAIACQLFAGVRKELPDAMRIRGDINVLLFGDPSVAKSQLLKFAFQVAPIGVYTSGKGSSAAGLTASVIPNKGTGEFYLEGGAMVLADGGIVCIDEFDKMRESDRVAIHEAMEQQTISIAKAGLTAVLNTRAAVLAAANPIFGRFDDLKSARDNIDFQTTILSRFDLIFIIRDIIDEQRDRLTASHILKVHTNAAASSAGITIQGPEEATPMALKQYIAYARRTCNPVLSEDAKDLLKSEYVNMRAQIDNSESIPITVRQLEALVRISEALAKMELSPDVKEPHVKEAIRLFKASTFEAAKSGIMAPNGPVTEELRRECEKIERFVDRRCPIESKIPERALVSELQKASFTEPAIVRVLQLMIVSGQFQYINQRRVLKRVKNRDE